VRNCSQASLRSTIRQRQIDRTICEARRQADNNVNQSPLDAKALLPKSRWDLFILRRYVWRRQRRRAYGISRGAGKNHFCSDQALPILLCITLLSSISIILVKLLQHQTLLCPLSVAHYSRKLVFGLRELSTSVVLFSVHKINLFLPLLTLSIFLSKFITQVIITTPSVTSKWFTFYRRRIVKEKIVVELSECEFWDKHGEGKTSSTPPSYCNIENVEFYCAFFKAILLSRHRSVNQQRSRQ